MGPDVSVPEDDVDEGEEEEFVVKVPAALDADALVDVDSVVAGCVVEID